MACPNGLGDETFPALCFLSFNTPTLHQVNFDRLVVRWEKGDHTLGEKEANRGNVLGRLEEQHKHTIFDSDGAVAAVDDSDSEEEDGDRFPGKGRPLTRSMAIGWVRWAILAISPDGPIWARFGRWTAAAIWVR